MHLYTHTDTLI